MPKKRTFDLNDKIELLWEEYEKKCDASFTKMANNAILEYLTRKLKKKAM